MSRAIKWRLQFKSLQNIGCLVNIYEDGYTSGADTTKTGADVPFDVESSVRSLTGAATPFEYQEENSEDLLTLIRYRTGYIRVVESSYDELADLMPTTLTAHYVEAFYGSELVFTGYMQMQAFQQPWTASPRELEFPIISPLGLLSSFDFPTTVGPRLTTMGTLLKAVADGLDAGYTEVAYPVDPETTGTAALYPWAEKVSGCVACPPSSEFDAYNNGYTIADLYEPKTFEYFIHGVCAAMGWMVHDWPGRLFFTDMHCSSCGLIPLTSAADGTTTEWSRVSGNASIGNYFREADDDANISTIAPLKSLELNYEGEKNVSHDLPTDFGYIRAADTVASFSADGKWGFGLNMRIAGDFVTSGFPFGATFLSNGNLSTASTFAALVVYGVADSNQTSLSPSKFWVVYPGQMSSTYKTLLAYTAFGVGESGTYLVKLALERGTDLRNMAASDWSNDLTLYLDIRDTNSDKYLNIQSDAWASSPARNTITVSRRTGKPVPNTSSQLYDCDGIAINIPINIKDIEITLSASSASGIGTSEFIKFGQFSLVRQSQFGADLLDWNSHIDKLTRRLKGSNKGMDDGSLTLELNNNYLYPNSHYFKGDGAEMGDKYAHVFTPHSILTERFRRKNPAGTTFAWYAKGYSYWRSSWAWRILAHAFNLRDDEVELTLVTPNVAYSYVRYYNVTSMFVGVSWNAPARIAEGSRFEYELIPDSGYGIDYVQVRMGGTVISAYDSGKVIISSVTGAIEVTATASELPFTVTNRLTNVTTSYAGTTVNGGDSYQATLTADSHYAISSVTVLMGGTDVTSQVYSNGTVNIPYVTGDIIITAVGEASEYPITRNLSHVTLDNSADWVAANGSFQCHIIEDNGYHLDSGSVKVYMDELDITSEVRYSDVIYIEHVTGPVVIEAQANQNTQS